MHENVWAELFIGALLAGITAVCLSILISSIQFRLEVTHRYPDRVEQNVAQT
jgi:ABC-type phosphate/phosphonate transport system permease subunit